MNAIKMKWAPAAIGVNKDWIPNDFSINYEDVHKTALTKWCHLRQIFVIWVKHLL